MNYKRKLIFVAACAAISGAAHAQSSSVTLYGVIDVGLNVGTGS